MGADIRIPGDPEKALRGEGESGGVVEFVDDEMDDIVWGSAEGMGNRSHHRENAPHRRSIGGGRERRRWSKTAGKIGDGGSVGRGGRGRMNVEEESTLCLGGWWSGVKRLYRPLEATTIGLLNLSTSPTSLADPADSQPRRLLSGGEEQKGKERNEERARVRTRSASQQRPVTGDGQPDHHAGILSETPLIVTPPHSPGQLPIPDLQSAVIHVEPHLLQPTQYTHDRDLHHRERTQRPTQSDSPQQRTLASPLPAPSPLCPGTCCVQSPGCRSRSWQTQTPPLPGPC